MLKAVINFYDELEEKILVYSFMFSVVLLFIQVIMRYIMGNSLTWSEELARYIFLWQIWLGTSFAARKDRHIRVDILPNMLKEKGLCPRFDLFVSVIWLAFSLFLTYQGFILTKMQIEINQLSSALRMPMAIAYASVPVGCGFMSLRLIAKIFASCKKTR